MTVPVEFQAVILDGRSHDEEGVLVFRAGRLLGLLTRLSGIHGDQEGQWFVETIMGDLPTPADRVLPDLGAAEEWALGGASEGADPPPPPGA